MNINPIRKAQSFTKMTDEELAKLLQVSRQTISSYKKNPSSIPTDKLIALSRGTGISLDLLLENTEVFQSPNILHTYADRAAAVKDAISVGLENLNSIESFVFDKKYIYASDAKEKVVESLRDTLRMADIQIARPCCAFMGESDTGKSTIINYMLGKNIAPAGYSPLTCSPTYYMHSTERPSFLSNPVENAVVLGRSAGSGNERFSHMRIADEEYTKPYILRTGDAETVLRAYGTRDGAYFDDESIIIDEIVVFIEAPLLEEVSLIDYPGFGTGVERDDVSLTMDMSTVDVLFFLSRANGFLVNEKEILALAHVFSTRTSLDSVYVLGTHAHSIGDPNDVAEILSNGCERLVRVLSVDSCERLGVSINDYDKLRSRFFGFAPQSDFYCKHLNADIETTFPNVVRKKIEVATEEFFRASQALAHGYSDIINNLENDFNETKISDEERDAVLSALDSKYKSLMDSLELKIASCRQKSRAEFELDYKRIANVEYIKTAIKRRGFKNRQKDMTALADYLSQEVSEAFVRAREKYGKEFAHDLNEQLNNYKNTWNLGSYVISMKDFNFARSFASGLTGLTAYGALATWATIAAAGSNLGAYILIAKIVSALSAIGINLGGTATVIAWVASIGGPVVLGIATALIASAAMFGILSGTWESRVAKKLVTVFEEKNTCEKCLNALDGYWSDTYIALKSAMLKMHEDAKDEYRRKVDVQNLAFEDKIALNTILSMIYTLARNAHENMAKMIHPDDELTGGDN